MTNKDIFKAVGELSGELVEEAAAPKRPRRGLLGAIAALAACAAVVLMAWQPWQTPALNEPAVTGHAAADPSAIDSAAAETGTNGVMAPAETWAPVYIPPEPMPDSPDLGMAMDMVGFFIYDGRMYTQTTQCVGEELLGERLASVTGDIDEWSGAEEYVEGASSVAGEVYAVRGYDAGFRLALVSYGEPELYDCLSGVRLYSGADLYETRLHIENCAGAYFIADADWEAELDNRRALELEALEPFIATLLASPMQDWGPGSENGDIYDSGCAEAHLYLELADGTTVPLRLFENGCVKYDGSPARICAWMPGAIFDEVFAMCG